MASEDDKREYLESVVEGGIVNPDMDDKKARKEAEKARKEAEEGKPDPFQHEKDWAEAHGIKPSDEK